MLNEQASFKNLQRLASQGVIQAEEQALPSRPVFLSDMKLRKVDGRGLHKKPMTGLVNQFIRTLLADSQPQKANSAPTPAPALPTPTLPTSGGDEGMLLRW